MAYLVNIALLLLIIMLGYALMKAKMSSFQKNRRKLLSSLPSYYGKCTIVYNCLIIIVFLALAKINPALNAFSYFLPPLCFLVTFYFIISVNYKFHARKHYESFIKLLFWICTLFIIFITLLVVLSIFWESIKFFSLVPVKNFLFGLNWNPQNEASEMTVNYFGIVPLFAGSLLITFIAMIIALPIGLMSAIFLAEYSSKTLRTTVKPILEMLAGIPTVVYGYFAVIMVGPFIRELGEKYGFNVVSESALAAGLVMGVMIIPFILSLTDDIINSVPQTLRNAAYALGSTKYETIVKVVLPAAFPGIMGAILLAISRAIGETMIVTMAAGLNANLTLNPLQSVTTVTAQIVSLLTGDQEFESAKTLAAFALALILFIVTLLINLAAIVIVNKYKEQYE